MHSKYQLSLQAAAFLFGASALIAEQLAVGVIVIVFARCLFASLTLTALVPFFRHQLLSPLSVNEMIKLSVSAALLALHWFSFFMGVKLGGLAIGTLGFACFPAFVIVFEALFFKEKITVHDGVIILLIGIGVGLITPNFDLSDASAVGMLWGLGSGVIYSIMMLTNRYLVYGVNPMQSSWVQCLVITFMLLPFAFEGMLNITLKECLLLAVLGVLCTGIAYTLFIYGVSGVKAKIAATVIALEPIYAILLAWIIFSQQPSWVVLSGGFSIILAVVISSHRRVSRGKKRLAYDA